jgi:hypothetical protein
MQPGQRDRISPVRLDPLARTLRDQGRRDHQAVVPQLLNLTIQPVPRRASFKANVQPAIPARQLLDRPLDRRRRVFNVTEEPHLAGPASLGNRQRVLRLCHVKCHECSAIPSHGSPSRA